MRMDVLIPFLCFLAGVAVEASNMLTRKWSVDRLQEDPSSLWLMSTLLIRLFGTAVVLLFAFRHSAASGLAGLAGSVLCRWAMIFWICRHT